MTKALYFLFLTAFLPECNRRQLPAAPVPKHENFSIYSNFIDEDREINVWLPPQYQNSKEKFPVLYMPDGGIMEDFPHIANTLDKLIKTKSIPPFILVGIENTERGRDLTGFSVVEADSQYCPLSDGAKNFRSFITDELVWEIEKKYRVNSKKGIIGESLAGLFVMETLFLKPASFDFYIAMDPSLWWNNHYLEREANGFIANLPKKKTKLWFAGSGAEDISLHTKNLAKTLNEKAPETLQWKYSDEPKEKHNTIFRATKEKALIWVLND